MEAELVPVVEGVAVSVIDTDAVEVAVTVADIDTELVELTRAVFDALALVELESILEAVGEVDWLKTDVVEKLSEGVAVFVALAVGHRLTPAVAEFVAVADSRVVTLLLDDGLENRVRDAVADDVPQGEAEFVFNAVDEDDAVCDACMETLEQADVEWIAVAVFTAESEVEAVPQPVAVTDVCPVCVLLGEFVTVAHTLDNGDAELVAVEDTVLVPDFGAVTLRYNDVYALADAVGDDVPQGVADAVDDDDVD